jgi:squalene-hopene/tetraprenyl-beta-curcumene cyclase
MAEAHRDSSAYMGHRLILIPTQSPINMYNLSSWARATCMPLLLIRHHEPIYALPNGLSKNNDFLSELWTQDISETLSYGAPLWTLWKRQEFASLFFTAADKALCILGKYFNSPLRTWSRKNIVNWILDRQEHSGDWVRIIGIMEHYHIWQKLTPESCFGASRIQKNLLNR